DVPLVHTLVDVLRVHLAGRSSGPVFRCRQWGDDRLEFDTSSPAALERELVRRLAVADADRSEPDRGTRARLARRLWRDVGAADESRVLVGFVPVARTAGLAGQTAPKVFRHQFATALQEGRVDPLVRNLLMGHASAAARSPG